MNAAISCSSSSKTFSPWMCCLKPTGCVVGGPLLFLCEHQHNGAAFIPPDTPPSGRLDVSRFVLSSDGALLHISLCNCCYVHSWRTQRLIVGSQRHCILGNSPPPLISQPRREDHHVEQTRDFTEFFLRFLRRHGWTAFLRVCAT